MGFAGVEQQPHQRRLLVRTKKRQHKIVDQGEIVERGRQLKGAHHPLGDPFLGRHAGGIFATIANDPFVGRVISGQQIEESRLARAVRTDNAGDFIFLKDVVNFVDRNQSAESLRHRFRSNNLRASGHVVSFLAHARGAAKHVRLKTRLLTQARADNSSCPPG